MTYLLELAPTWPPVVLRAAALLPAWGWPSFPMSMSQGPPMGLAILAAFTCLCGPLAKCQKRALGARGCECVSVCAYVCAFSPCSSSLVSSGELRRKLIGLARVSRQKVPTPTGAAQSISGRISSARSRSQRFGSGGLVCVCVCARVCARAAIFVAVGALVQRSARVLPFGQTRVLEPAESGHKLSIWRCELGPVPLA